MSTSEYPARRLGDPKLSPTRAFDGARAIGVDWLAVGFLVALAATIRFGGIAHQSFWTDEALTVYEVKLPFGGMLHTVAHVETTPPLYFVLIWVWGKLLGTSEIAMRSLSALAGCALVPIAYLSARELISRWAGVIAAAFVAVNPFLIWYSQEARAYMLLAALTGASFLFFVRACREPSARNLVWWAICSSLALMTHFFAGFMIGPEAVWLLWTARTRGAALAVTVVAGAQLAMAPFAFADSSHGVGWIALTSRFYRVGQVPLEFGLQTLFRRYTPQEGLIGGGVLVAVALALLVLRGDRATRRGAALAAGVAAVSILAPLLIGFVGPDVFLARNVIGSWLPLAVAIAAACAVPRARVLGGLLAAVLIAMFVAAQIDIASTAAFQRPAWRALAHAIGPATRTRAIMSAGGTSADPLKLYLPHVRWNTPSRQKNRIYEIDVIGTRRRQSLITDVPDKLAIPKAQRRVKQYGSPLPRSIAPPGTRLIAHFRLDQWTVSRFVLDSPMVLDTAQLTALRKRFFRRPPSSLLVIVQHPGR
jgi:mannosyltransferase